MVEGVVKVIAKTGGIVLEGHDGVWYNPVDELKDELKNNWKRYKGKKCVLTIDAEGKVSAIKPAGGGTSSTNKASVDGEGLGSERIIIREVCIKAAVEAYKATPDKFSGRADIVAVAAEFERWIVRDLDNDNALKVTHETI